MNRRVIGALLALVVVSGGLIGGGYAFGSAWMGFFYEHTPFEWLDVLIIPVVISIALYLLDRSQKAREEHIADLRMQDTALQAYLDQMANMLLDKDRPLRLSKEGDEVRTIARARTFTVLPRLDGSRKRSVVQFLYESGLINKPAPVVVLGGAPFDRAPLDWFYDPPLSGSDALPITTSGADLSGVDLHDANLRRADLSGTNLSRADLNNANLFEADLSSTDLREANLRRTDLREANLNNAHLKSANLCLAMLHKAKLNDTTWYEANLSGANLTGAEVNRTALTDAKLDRTLMPDGTFYTTPQKQKTRTEANPE